MTREERDWLRGLAAKATPGEREIKASEAGQYRIWLYAKKFIRICQFNTQINRSNDAAFIAAVDPATITALLDHIDRLERDARAGRELRAAVYCDDEHCLQCVSSLATDAYDTATKETASEVP